MAPLPPIAKLASAPTPDITTVLDTLFEPTSHLRQLAASRLLPASYADYNAFIDAVAELLFELHAAGDQRLIEILAAHPRLGEKKVDSEMSRAEQRNLGGGEERLARLNREYEERFPGMRFVVFVNGRSREEVMGDMEVRIKRDDIDAEKVAAIEAMRDIAKDRASKLS